MCCIAGMPQLKSHSLLHTWCTTLQRAKSNKIQLYTIYIQQVQLKSWRGKVIVGAAAGRYHSVFCTRNEVYSCGLNAGQLGKACVYTCKFSNALG